MLMFTFYQSIIWQTGTNTMVSTIQHGCLGVRRTGSMGYNNLSTAVSLMFLIVNNLVNSTNCKNTIFQNFRFFVERFDSLQKPRYTDKKWNRG